MILVTMAYAQDEEVIPPEQIPNLPTFPPPTGQAGVVVIASSGGTTEPVPGTYAYENQTKFTIKATPYSGYRFLYWVISGQFTPGHNLPPVVVPDPIPEDWVPKFPDPQTAGWDSLVTSQNPLSVICGYGYTYQYQAVFAPTAAPTPVGNTVVVMLEALGGTTDPNPGTFYHESGAKLTIKATPNEGYVFDYWIAKGPVDAIIVDNPADISCQEGTTYTYQPVFVPHGTETPSTGTPVEYFYAAIIILAIIAVIGIAAALMFRSRGSTSK
jgi:hypothetical protein